MLKGWKVAIIDLLPLFPLKKIDFLEKLLKLRSRVANHFACTEIISKRK